MLKYRKINEWGMSMNGKVFANSVIADFDDRDYEFESILEYEVLNNDGNIAEVEIKLPDANSSFVLKYPVITTKMIAKVIENGENANFDYCYIKDLDLNYILTKLNKYEVVELENFSARYAFIDGGINFGKMTLRNLSVDLTGANFVMKEAKKKCGINFFENELDRVKFIFKECKFLNCELNFPKLKLNEADFIFDISKFINTKVYLSWLDLNKGLLSFENVYAEGSSIKFESCVFGNVQNLCFKKIASVEIYDCTIMGVLLMHRLNPQDIEIEKLSLLNTKNLGHIYINWVNVENGIANYDIDEDGKIINENSSKPDKERFYHAKARQMRMLKENFHAIAKYDNEDMAFAQYMRYKRKYETNYIKIFLNFLVDKIGVYATKPSRVAICMLVTWFVFGLIFAGATLLSGLQSGGKILVGTDFLEGFYFSAITFLTIGYGDISPIIAITKILAPLEGFLGLFLMSYFTVAVVRKTLR